MMVTAQLNLCASVGVEKLCRYLYQIETAVAKNPKVPDFEDIEVVAGTTITSAGTLVLPEYSKYVTEVQKDEAYLLKNRRLWQEERDKDVNKVPPAGKQGGGRGGKDGGGRGRKPGRGRGDDSAGSGAAPAGA